MSFTRSEIVSISKITGVDRIVLQNHLALYPTEIDSIVEDDVRDEITRWTTGGIGTDFVAIEPKEANLGARLDAGDAKADVIKNIARLLLLGDLVQLGGSNWGYNTRS